MPLAAANLSALLGRPDWSQQAVAALARPVKAGIPAGEVKLELPLPAPGKIICCGLNYADHILEMGRGLPNYPTLFAKFADTLTGPGEHINIPSRAQGAVDWEAELAVVVGAPLRQADDDEAREAIAGYTLANDISMRDWQNRTAQWLQGKAFDATTPIGPVLVTPDEFDSDEGIEINCQVNGALRQRGNTKNLVFAPAKLLAYISQFTTLRPGDIVLTGTPGGVGMGRRPPLYLADGDTVVIEATRLGRLENTIRFNNN